VRVPENAEDLAQEMVSYPGKAGTVLGYLSRRHDLAVDVTHPAVLVIHENAGLTPHIMDVTRRLAREGFVALGVDLLSRYGGTQNYPDPADAQRAYASLSSQVQLEDMLSSLEFLKWINYVNKDRLGAIGFCAGGSNCWNIAVGSPDIKAAAVFYGAPPAVELLDKLNGPVLLNYAELDRGFTGRVPAVITALNDKRKTYGLNIYEGANHAFHNDTSPRYDAAAACDAWSKTLSFFNRHLRK
jgi:carboxymethylenebutenolidase